ncbi:MAG: hypothetical protein IJ727_08705 [Treponema sp.]|nr:hypothetical protein [Treponema sp.]
MMKKVLEILLALSMVTCLNCFLSCSDIETSSANVTDISKNVAFRSLFQQGYMGGSILYNPCDESSGQLASNVTVAIRLGHVSKKLVEDDEYTYSDLPEQAQYGTIYIKSIDEKSISFDVSLFDSKGIYLGERFYCLALGDSVDINFDGIADVDYNLPCRKRQGFEKAIYLSFLSSQESQTTSMFALLPEQYARSVYPSGILGINPNGRFIVNMYEVGSASRAVIRGICSGDYVLDSITGEYKKFIGSENCRAARTLTDSDLETTNEVSVQDFYFKNSEFENGYSAKELLSEIPAEIYSEYGIADSEEKAVEILNLILVDRNLSRKIAQFGNIESNNTELQAAMEKIAELNDEELLQYNRLLLESLYTEYCPQVNCNGTDITEVLPLLSVNICEETSDEEFEDDVANSRAAIGTAKDYSEYLRQKKEIERIKSGYKEIHTFRYNLSDLGKDLKGKSVSTLKTKMLSAVSNIKNWKEFFNSKGESEKNNSSSDKSKIQQFCEKYFYEIIKDDNKVDERKLREKINDAFAAKKKPDFNTQSIKNEISVTPCVKGSFHISWGNVGGSLVGGIYVKADSNFDVAENFINYDADSIPSINAYKATFKLFDKNINGFKSPSVPIGPITLNFSLNGGIKIPASVSLSGNISTAIFIGYTGFYAVGFEADADASVKYKKIRIFRKKIKIPYGFSIDVDASPITVNKTAFYAGPTREVKPYSFFKIEKANFNCEISPYIYAEPRIEVCRVLFGGLEIGPELTIGVGADLYAKNPKSVKPTELSTYYKFGAAVKTSASYGVGIKVPVINIEKEIKGTVPINNPLKVETKKYTISTIPLK